jgi:hypothetical protein
MMGAVSRCICVMVLLLLVSAAQGWDSNSHRRITAAALGALPEDVPAFLRQGVALASDTAVEPDAMRLPATAALRVAESPEHFIDLELMGGRDLPPDRYKFLALCHEIKQDPAKVGLVPYAITEAAQRLAVALADHRRRPDDLSVQARCVYHAGILSHYAADMCMPLHTTVHFDGRVNERGRSPRSGIHLKVDALLAKLPPEAWTTVPPVTEPVEQLWPAVLAQLHESHALVEAVYALEPLVPEADAPIERDEVRQFATQRAHTAATFLARLILTAWRSSGELVLPEWLGP